MSKNNGKTPQKPQETPEIVVSDPVKLRTVATHKRCPVCWERFCGEGKQYGQHHKGLMTRLYLQCDQCGHTWTADVRVEVVAVDHRLPENISTR